jgi:hypothetical protein
MTMAIGSTDLPIGSGSNPDRRTSLRSMRAGNQPEGDGGDDRSRDDHEPGEEADSAGPGKPADNKAGQEQSNNADRRRCPAPVNDFRLHLARVGLAREEVQRRICRSVVVVLRRRSRLRRDVTPGNLFSCGCSEDFAGLLR